MTQTLVRPTVLTATEASRNFAAVVERAKLGESFAVTKSGVEVARIVPPEESKPNGAALREIIESWPGDSEGFTDEILAVIESFHEPNPRDQERMAWIDDYL
ncbi:MAG: type II toxin-antitoxin system prevent-host-death family antitoxin [Propionibacteriaceae bacterium]|jgi:prevent-host-death family protein|nr:type II toxin-antitoxin system prevent-host-death family antitoxin [Propionibacteriaceae bacterium]